MITSRLPSPRHIRVLVWSSRGAHHWRVTHGGRRAQGEAVDAHQAWACALAGMLGAIRVGQMADAIKERGEP